MMRRAPYVCNGQMYRDHFLGQVGGGGDYFQGDLVQEGYGLGNVLGGLIRQALPLALKYGKPLAKRSAQELLKTGTNIVNDVVIKKRKPITSIKSHGLQSLQNIVSQTGKGSKKSSKKRKGSKAKRCNLKRLRKDIFQ